MSSYADIQEVLADQAEYLLDHSCETVPRDQLHLPGPDFIDRVTSKTDRRPAVLRNLASLYGHGRLAATGYVSILPVDQGIEHAAGASFAPNPIYFDPANICELAIAGGCNAVASTLGVLGAVARQYAHKIPLILKFNHNELLTTPNKYDQTIFASIEQAFEMGCVGVGATIYWGSEESNRQLQEVSADLTGQANHLGVTLEADIIKQKLPTNNGGYPAIKAGKTHDKVYSELTTDHPIDLTRYQVVNNYMGRMGLINSGGASGSHDLQDATSTAVINKRAGGMVLISGRKAFQKPMEDGVALLNAIQDVYLCEDVTVA